MRGSASGSGTKATSESSLVVTTLNTGLNGTLGLSTQNAACLAA